MERKAVRLVTAAGEVDVPLGVFAAGDHAMYDGKQLLGQPQAVAKLNARMRVTADRTSTSTSFASVAEFSQALAVGTYDYQFSVFYSTNTTTEGIGLGFNFTGSFSTGAYVQAVWTSATTQSITYRTGVTTNQQTVGPGSSVTTLALLDGSIVVSVAGTFSLIYATETGGANSSTIKAGSKGFICQQ